MGSAGAVFGLERSGTEDPRGKGMKRWVLGSFREGEHPGYLCDRAVD